MSSCSARSPSPPGSPRAMRLKRVAHLRRVGIRDDQVACRPDSGMVKAGRPPSVWSRSKARTSSGVMSTVWRKRACSVSMSTCSSEPLDPSPDLRTRVDLARLCLGERELRIDLRRTDDLLHTRDGQRARAGGSPRAARGADRRNRRSSNCGRRRWPSTTLRRSASAGGRNRFGFRHGTLIELHHLLDGGAQGVQAPVVPGEPRLRLQLAAELPQAQLLFFWRVISCRRDGRASSSGGSVCLDALVHAQQVDAERRLERLRVTPGSCWNARSWNAGIVVAQRDLPERAAGVRVPWSGNTSRRRPRRDLLRRISSRTRFAVSMSSRRMCDALTFVPRWL